jgi:Chromosome segregation ATPases
LADCEAQIADFQKQLKDVQQLKQKTPADIEKNIGDLRDKYVDLLQEQVSNNNEQNFSQKQLDRIQALLDDQNQQIQTINDELSQSQDKHQTIESKVKALIADNKSLIEHDQALAKEIDQVTETGKQENRNYLSVLEGLQEIKARKKVLENMEQEHAGFFEGAKNVLNNQSKLTGIVGAIAELISVPKEYQLAIETVVSNQLQSIVTEDEGSAKQAIAYLRQSRGGRATFFAIKYY